MSEFSQKVKGKVRVDEFKEELWDSMVGFGEPVLIASGLDEKAREELLDEIIRLRDTKSMIKIKDNNIFKTRGIIFQIFELSLSCSSFP